MSVPVGHAVFTPAKLSLPLSRAIPPLLYAAARGDLSSYGVTVYFVNSASFVYLQMRLYDVVVTSMSQGSGSLATSVSMTLKFGQIEYVYNDSADHHYSFCWNTVTDVGGF
jgi:type VI protein secretion system component Hcp